MNKIKRNLFLIALCLSSNFILSQNSKFILNEKKIWLVKASFSEIGEFNFYASSNQFDSLIIIKSFENRDKFILGSVKAKIFRTFQKRKYKKSLVAIEIKNETGQIHSIFGIFSLKDIIVNNDIITGQIYDDNYSEKLGQFTCKQISNSENIYYSIYDYQTICKDIINITSANIYNPKLIESNDWINFCKNIRKKSSKVYDDLEFLVLFFANARKAGFSHFSLIKSNIDLERTLEDPQIITNQINDTTVLFKVKTLSGRTTEIDSIFSKYRNFKIKIIDLRETPGGNFKSTFYFASHLLQDTVSAGAFITKDCNNCNKNIGQLYLLQKNEINDFSNILFEKKGIRIVLYPYVENKDIENGMIYILTSKNTASACEPLIYGLKQNINVKIIGDKTAGTILSPSVFDIGNDYFLIVPTADYLINEGVSLEKSGVLPSVKIKSNKALNYVFEELKIPKP